MYDLEEQEQIDALKAWWRQNGRLVIVVVIAAVVGAGGVMGWKRYQADRNEQASQLFSSVEKALRAGDAKQVRDTAAQLMDKYGNTAYGAMAALAAAKVNFDAGDLKGAASQLQWAIEHSKDDETKAVARLRLAAVRLDERQYDDALRLLQEKHPEAFAGMYADLRGDVLMAQGKVTEAKAAYKEALDKLPAEGTYRLLVQAKIDAAGGVGSGSAGSGATGPGATGPEATGPEATGPGATGSGTTRPGATEPGATETGAIAPSGAASGGTK